LSVPFFSTAGKKAGQTPGQNSHGDMETSVKKAKKEDQGLVSQDQAEIAR